MKSAHGTQDEDDDDRPAGKRLAPLRFEFECPSCSANNPWPDGFRAKDEVICHYCGITYRVEVTDEGVLKLREA